MTTNNIKITPADLKTLNKIKKALMSDVNATPSSQTRSHEELRKLADKYNVDIQKMYDSATN